MDSTLLSMVLAQELTQQLLSQWVLLLLVRPSPLLLTQLSCLITSAALPLSTTRMPKPVSVEMMPLYYSMAMILHLYNGLWLIATVLSVKILLLILLGIIRIDGLPVTMVKGQAPILI